MANITIYVEDALNEKLKKSDIKISATCQEALRCELRRMEGINISDAKLQKLREKVLSEKDEAKESGYKEGREEAYSDAENNKLRYADFVAAERGEVKQGDREEWEEYFDEQEAEIDIDSFLEGYLQGIREIAEKIKLK